MANAADILTAAFLAEVCTLARDYGVTHADDEIREAARGYVKSGAAGGGNAFGMQGTAVAFCVDMVRQASAAAPGGHGNPQS